MQELIQNLQQRFEKPLPGIDTMMTMSPPIRKRDHPVPDNHRKGAVLELLYPHEGNVYVALMKRVEDGTTHSGQISFPGGKIEERDENYRMAALREAEEELGILQHKVNIIGEMSELYIPPSNFMVYPTLGYMNEKPEFSIQTSEVALVVEAKLQDLLDESIIGRKKVPLSGNKDLIIEVPYYEIYGHTIWGATAMMIAELLQVLREAKL